MDFENLYIEPEPVIVQELFKGPHVIDNLLIQLGIKYPYCWAVTNIESKDILPSWSGEPGDIDIVTGNINFEEKNWDFSNLLAIQIKARRVTINDELKSFASGVGRGQSVGTLKMGFDRVFLLHILVRDPKIFGPEDHPNAPWLENSDFRKFEKANENLIVEYFNLNEQTFGYGWLAWGQVHGRNFWESGGSNYKILFKPPVNKTINRNNRKVIVHHLKNIIENDKSTMLPLIIHRKIRSQATNKHKI